MTNEIILAQTKIFRDPPDTKNGKLITFAICNGLERISEIAKEAQKQSLCLDEASKIQLAEEWINCLIDNKSKVRVPLPSPGQNIVNVYLKRFPTFKLKQFIEFEGNVQKYIDSVEEDFTENKVISFLEDASYAANYADVSKSYCLTLLKSLKYLVYELLVSKYKDTYKNLANLWKNS